MQSTAVLGWGAIRMESTSLDRPDDFRNHSRKDWRMVNVHRRAALLANGALILGLVTLTSTVGFGADEPTAPPKPQPPRTATAPHSKGVLTDQDGEPLQPLKSTKNESKEEKVHKDAMAWFMSGRLKQSESRFAEALSDYQMSVKLDPNSVEVYRALVPLAFALGETENGLKYAQRAIELDPQDLDILRMLAEQLHEQQQLDKAAEYLTRAANSSKVKKDSPVYVMFNLQLAAVYMEKARQDKSNTDPSIWQKAADAYIVVLDARRNPTKYNLDFQTRSNLERQPLAGYETMGDVLMVARRTAQAIVAFEEAAKANHEHPGALSFSLAQAYFQSKQYELALKNLQVYLDAQLQGKGRQPYELLAKILKATGKSGELLSRVQDLSKADPRNATLQYFLADQYVAAGRLKEAEDLIHRVITESRDTEGWVSLAAIYRKENNAEKLLDALAKGLHGQRGTNRLDHLLVEIQDDHKLVDAIIAAGRKLETTDKSKVDFYTAYLVARLAGRAQKMDAAVEFYTQAMAARRELQGQLADELAKELVLAKRYEQAVDVLKKAVAQPVYPPNAEGERVKLDLYIWLARAQELGGKTKEALQAFREAEKLDSEDPEIHFWEAWVYSHSHQWAEAIKRYEEMAKKYATHKEIVRQCQMSLSNCYVQEGNLAKGEKLLEDVLVERPDDSQANNDLGYLYADQSKNLPQAEKMIRVALKLEPDNVAYLDSMGWVLFKQGKLEEARTFLQKAVATPGGSDGTIWEHLGDCYAAMKNHDKAADAWKKGLKDSQEESFPDSKLIERLKDKLKKAGA
jgi:tetratricopeptide (TPR) repeat protein